MQEQKLRPNSVHATKTEQKWLEKQILSMLVITYIFIDLVLASHGQVSVAFFRASNFFVSGPFHLHSCNVRMSGAKRMV